MSLNVKVLSNNKKKSPDEELILALNAETQNYLSVAITQHTDPNPNLHIYAQVWG